MCDTFYSIQCALR
jgi:HSP20 family molecular chaperone IbpA